MSFLQGTANLVRSSVLPPGTTVPLAHRMLSDHEFIIRCDPVLDKYELLPPVSPPNIPDDIRSRVRTDINPAPAIAYKVTDIVHAIPAGIWDTNVVSTFEFTDIDSGLFVRVKSPMGIIIDTIWEVREAEEEGQLELVENVTVSCSRFLVGMVKNQCESGWKQMHGKLLERLKGDVESGKNSA
ncbi:hypothetical protein QBC38DRAFT_188959 [Podospora fimiseda]|uniref:DUF7053 domain-containing protein n=1 Tax=Podospora fimiseda TaxID=252190 RepID=A0AAN7BQ91_9PEZI|nr:hypothetical protein QBC38DRAFT_188959 [Podospora fimiseda]